METTASYSRDTIKEEMSTIEHSVLKVVKTNEKSKFLSLRLGEELVSQRQAVPCPYPLGHHFSSMWWSASIYISFASGLTKSRVGVKIPHFPKPLCRWLCHMFFTGSQPISANGLITPPFPDAFFSLSQLPSLP